MKTREEIAQALAASGYIADAELATAISLMQLLRRPLLLEGEAGVGKTEVAKALATAHATELIRLQCYEGLDQSAALYEWNYQRQLLAIQAHRGEDADTIEDQIFSEKYLLERPLLAAIRREKPPVLLIDEIDRADDEFEAFLLELLSDFQVSIPELGTIAGEGRVSCCGASPGFDEVDEVSRLVSAKLAAFLRTLRDSGYPVGLQEGRDAAQLMAAGYAARPALLRSAFKHLFSARKSDWDKFDGIFDAFWLGKRVRSRSVTAGSARAANNPSLKSLQNASAGQSQSATDQIPSPDEAPEGRSGEGRMEGASRADNLAEVDFRKLADPDQIEQAHAAEAQLAH